MQRCGWVPKDNHLYQKYHDKEWGLPVHNDRILFEFLILEGAQAGLSWSTVLKKRENYRKAMDNFDFNKVAKYSEKKLQALLGDKGLIRNRLKMQSSVRNAKAFLKIRKECGTFSKYLWQFVGNKPINHKIKTWKQIPVKTELSDKISQDLKKRGMNFVGSTIIYAYLQAVGVVNDHETTCFRYKEVQ